MAKVFFTQELDLSKIGEVWEAKNGATRRNLLVINKISFSEKTTMIDCQLGFLDKGNHSFIFINDPKKEDNRILGVALNSSYSYTVIAGAELYVNHSSGGYGNSCSTFGIYEVGTILKEHTYKNRREENYVKLTESGWVYISSYEIEKNEMEEV